MPYTLDVDGRTLEATEEQAAIIDYALANPRRGLLVNSCPGSAKTSTLRFTCKYLPVIPTVSLAFNKRIADTMAAVLPGHCKSSTVNSLGHRAWGPVIGKSRLTVDTKKNFNIIKELVETLPRRARADAYEVFGDLTKALSRAKLAGYVPAGNPGKSLLTADAFFGGLEEAPDDWFCGLVNKALTTGIKQAYAGLIDFDDQVYMSTLFGGTFPQFARVMVDEAQDLSPLNHAMVDRLVGPNTQLIAVGDPFQSIYAFRGADTRSMTWLREHFNMHEMTLSVNFRCPISVVRNAHWRAPHMRWPSWAALGKVETLDEWGPRDIPDNSAILCRNNAPLLSCALALLRSGRGVRLVGTDLGPQLTRTLEKLGPPTLTREQVNDRINEWEAEKLRKSRSPDGVVDKAECLRVFAGFGRSLGEAVAYCKHLFASQGPIQLLSGHKAKGLEWDTVYHLDPHRIPSPWSRSDEALEQEWNVRYVIETRAKEALYKVKLENLTNGIQQEPSQLQ